ncbi:MAG: nickel pincer cofactor biosynthesis protein LarC [Treponema sp.]|nr:nickel pincer cofactor biosynthesis protein LarC [Treponema sp.]
MRFLHFDCNAGISGDMVLGALVDLGVDPDTLRGELEKLGAPGWKLRFDRTERGGITGVQGVVELEEAAGRVSRASHHEPGDQHEHSEHPHGEHTHHEHSEHAHGDHGEHTHHTHSEHSHGDHGGHHGHEPGEHSHNTWREIRGLIENSGISGGAKKRALDIFTRIAEAEAQVHGVKTEDVRFHEVGALDSIIDVVGAAVCLDLLGPERITCGEVELGGGMVHCAHGLLPVPAPATLLLVQGMPVRTGGFNKEMTTPTGAAILAASVDEFIPPGVSSGVFRELKTAYGIGTRRTERPNLLRVSLRESGGASGAESSPAAPWKAESLVLLETNIDDMSGEALGFLMERLFDAGALDVTMSPCVMKKSRPGTVVSVLGSPARLDALRECLFRHSAAAGFREIPVNRLSLARQEDRVSGDFGEARRKTLWYGDTPLRSKVEFEDRARLARERGISLEEAEKIISAR